MAIDKKSFMHGKIELGSDYDFQDFDHVIEGLINKISRYPSIFSHIEYSFVLHKNEEQSNASWFDVDIYPGTERWGKMPANVLGTKGRKNQRIILYNVNTKFWIILYNKNTPTEFVKFIKDNKDMFTHVMSFNINQLNDAFLAASVNSINVANQTTLIKTKVSSIVGFVTNDLVELIR